VYRSRGRPDQGRTVRPPSALLDAGAAARLDFSTRRSDAQAPAPAQDDPALAALATPQAPRFEAAPQAGPADVIVEDGAETSGGGFLGAALSALRAARAAGDRVFGRTEADQAE